MMQAYGLTSIDIQTHGNDITIELKGQFIDTRYSLAGVDVKRRYSGIELIIITDFDLNTPVNTDKAPLNAKLSVTQLNPGVYYVRVNGNNNWIKWCKIVSPVMQSVTTAQLRY